VPKYATVGGKLFLEHHIWSLAVILSQTGGSRGIYAEKRPAVGTAVISVRINFAEEKELLGRRSPQKALKYTNTVKCVGSNGDHTWGHLSIVYIHKR